VDPPLTERQSCADCGDENASGQRFCGSCGRPLFRTCASCGKENPPEFNFCGACGNPLAATPRAVAAMEGERRWVSVLFADLADFTSLSDRADPEEIRLMVDGCTSQMGEIVDGYGGWVDKVIGDALMAVFGAPVAHEDDAERAVRAGLELQRYAVENSQALAGLPLRIGVDSGDVIFAPVGPGERREPTVMGDTVNTASRLQAAAPLGGVLIGEETRRACAKAIRCQAVEPIEVKGKGAPVSAWLAKEINPATPGELSDEPMLGREVELELLRSTWERVVDLRQPHLLSLLGQPGIGKTRLCDEFVRVVEEGGARVVRGRSLPYGESPAYGAFAEMIRFSASIAAADAPAQTGKKLERHLENLSISDPQRVLGHLLLLAGFAEDPVGDRAVLFSSARDFIEALAKERPTLFVFEDIHWADPSLLDLIEWVAAHVREIPAMLVTIGRPEILDVRGGWGGGIPRHTAVSLDPLPALASHALALRRLRDAPDSEAAARRVEEAAGGNPLFVEELTAAMAEGATEPADQLPVAVRGIIAARLDALPAEERQLLLDASVAGSPFSRGMMEALAPRDFDLSQALENLEFRDLIRRQHRPRMPDSEEFSFKHALIREVAYGTLPHAVRRERHATLATFLEESPDYGADAAGLLGHHWREAGTSERAIPYLLTAAEQADRGWAAAEVLDLYKEALELIPKDDEDRRHEVSLKQAIAYARFTHLMIEWEQLERAQRELQARPGSDPYSVSSGNRQG
jgi:class 3 adenylate cyclase